MEHSNTNLAINGTAAPCAPETSQLSTNDSSGLNGAPQKPIPTNRYFNPQGMLRDLSGISHDELFEARMIAFSYLYNFIAEDLTGVDLEPLWDLAPHGTTQSVLETLQKDWKPKTFSLTYNGPLGEDGRPLPSNHTKWRNFKDDCLFYAKDDFEAGDMPKALKKATKGLIELATDPFNGGSQSIWFDFQRAEDINAARAAIKLAQDALLKLSNIVETHAENQVGHLQLQLAKIQQGGK